MLGRSVKCVGDVGVLVALSFGSVAVLVSTARRVVVGGGHHLCLNLAFGADLSNREGNGDH